MITITSSRRTAEAVRLHRREYFAIEVRAQHAGALVLAGPGVPGGVRDDALVYQASIYPTLCALTGDPAHREVVERLPRLLRARQNELGGDCGEWTIEIDDNWPAVKANA